MMEDKKLLSIYFTAGYPALDDTVKIIQDLEKNGVDMIEIGLPFSDPLADGPTIQKSSTAALKNGMTTEILFEQLKDIRKSVSIPLIIMGYFNPMLQYGVEAFCKKCQEIGIDGLIIPDLPVDVYHEEYQAIFEKYGLINVFLITPRLRKNVFGLSIAFRTDSSIWSVRPVLPGLNSVLVMSNKTIFNALLHFRSRTLKLLASVSVIPKRSIKPPRAPKVLLSVRPLLNI